MKKGLIKYSDERNKHYSIKTVVSNTGLDKVVYKEAIFQEGISHIKNIYESQKLLSEYYGNVRVSKGTLKDNKIYFEYISGISLEEKYKNAYLTKDKDEYERLLKMHKAIALGGDNNQCEFAVNDEFIALFGDGSVYKDTKGLKFSNFDAIPSNIIYKNEEPTFIDYEWTMDFYMPVDLVLYNCVSNIYLKNQELEGFYPFVDALKYVEVKTDIAELKKNYRHFFKCIISEEDEESYIEDKIACLKPLDTIDSIRTEWENCANYWKASVAANDEKDKEIVELKQKLETVQSEKDSYKNLYEEIVNSRSWKMVSKVRNTVRKN